MGRGKSGERKSGERRTALVEAPKTEQDGGAAGPTSSGRQRGSGAWRLGIGLLAAIVMLGAASIKNSQGVDQPQSGAARPAAAGPASPQGAGGLPLVGELFRERPSDVDGTVRDAQSKLPLAGARLEWGGQAATADGAGMYRLEGLPKEARLTASAPGYRSKAVPVGRGGTLPIELEPLIFSGVVRDASTEQPVAGARVAAAGRDTSSDAAGRFELVAVPEGTAVTVEAEGYARAEATAGTPLVVALRPNVLSGQVTEAGTGKPVAGASVAAGTASATSDGNGHYRLGDLPAEGKVVASAPGYDRVELALPRATRYDFQLKALAVKAAYMTLSGIGYKPMREKVLDLIDKTELNALVIDVKDDDGSLVYESEVPLAKAIGALERTTLPDPEEFIASLKKRGIYTIARIITFKDDLLAENGAKAGVDVGLKDTRTGRPWKDSAQGLGWLDPFRTEAWDYNIAIAKEAARKGFDEIQFDYIRFPADPAVRYTRFAEENNSANRVAAINGFLERAQRELQPLGVYLAVDVFGYASWQGDDANLPLGQNIEEMAQYVDFIAPMNYPSLFWYGLPTTPSYEPAEDYPYEIVRLSVEKARERIAGTKAIIRTWIQYYNGNARPYGANEIIAQKEGAIDGGSVGWMLWEPFVEYEKGGLAGD